MFYSQAFGETLSSGVKRLIKYQLTSVSVITLSLIRDFRFQSGKKRIVT